MIQTAPQVLELKRGSVDTAGRFSGYCSTSGPPADSDNDIIMKGAWAPALELMKSEGRMPALLWHHDQNEPIGRWDSMVEDEHGLLGSGQLTLGTKRGAEAYALMKDNAISLSIGFNIAPGGAETKGGIRYISKIAKLWEVSVVSIPANSRAKVIQAKSSPRDFERFLRDAGLSAREAKRATAGGYSTLVREGRDTTLDAVLSEIQQLRNLIERGN